jgi:hypothetical protein
LREGIKKHDLQHTGQVTDVHGIQIIGSEVTERGNKGRIRLPLNICDGFLLEINVIYADVTIYILHKY